MGVKIHVRWASLEKAKFLQHADSHKLRQSYVKLALGLHLARDPVTCGGWCPSTGSDTVESKDRAVEFIIAARARITWVACTANRNVSALDAIKFSL